MTQAQLQGQLSPYSSSGQSIGQSVANVARPQSTGNLAGELGGLNAQTGVTLAGAGASLQGLGTLAQQELAGQQLQTQGADHVAGLTAPQPYGITSTSLLAWNKQVSGSLPGGASGAFGAGQVQGNVGLGSQFQSTLLPAYNNAGTIKSDLQNFLTQKSRSSPLRLLKFS